jgi:1-acyl-sn-glycerol-3-phosphate acyltransferase
LLHHGARSLSEEVGHGVSLLRRTPHDDSRFEVTAVTDPSFGESPHERSGINSDSPTPTTSPGGARDSTLVLREIGVLLDQLHLHPQRPLSLDSDLTSDLGVDSLALVELFDVFLTATSPRDWLDAVRAARGETIERKVPSPRAPLMRRPAGEPWPDNVATLTEALAWHVEKHPDLICIRLLETDSRGAVEDVSYASLAQQSRVVASGLIAGGLGHGERVAIMLPTGKEYFIVFLGVLLAGGVPVPIYPPAQMAVLEAHLTRQSRLLENAGATVLVTVPEAMVAARLVRARVASLRKVCTAQSLVDAGQQPLPLPEVGVDDMALIQYTSGSTGDPKGVVLTNRQLIANIESMGRAIDIDSSDVLVTWLPLYHDMGLIGSWHAPLYFGVPIVVMSPLTFLAHPASWLQAISAYSGTLSAGPNFAYQSCADRITDSELNGLDLSSWRIAFNGSEPVSESTLDRFIERFTPCGFRRTAMCPAYGLAEMGVGLAFTQVGHGPRVDTIERATLQRSSRAVATTRTNDAVTIVGCGRALPDCAVRVVGPEGEALPERIEGKVECRGPSATSGYFMNDAANRSLWHDGWLDTGDLGYIADGDLFLTGRSKDLVIRGGRKLHPEELEQSLEELIGVIRGGVAVFARADTRLGTEQIVVVAETELKDPAARTALEAAIGQRGMELLGAAPDQVVLTTRGALPRTASGKLRRSATRDALASGELGRRPAPVPVQLLRFAWSGLGPTLRRTPRMLSGGLYAVYGWVVLAPVAICTWVLSVAPLTMRTRCALARSLGRTACRTLRISFAVEGTLARATNSLVITANHSSLIDGVILFMICEEPVAFVTSTDMQHKWGLGRLLGRFGCVFVDRGDPRRSADSVERMVDVVRSGRWLALFPEGSLSGARGLRPFHLGAFEVAASADCPVVPVAIKGTREILSPGSFRLHPGTVRVVIGVPVAPTGTDFAAKVCLRDTVRSAVVALGGDESVAM